MISRQAIEEFLMQPMILRIIYIIVAISFIYLLGKAAKRLLIKYVSNDTTRYQAKKFVNLAAYILFAISALIIYNYNLNNVTIAIGLAGAGIAFALQEVIVSIAGFLAILSGSFYKVGDRIQLGGTKGDVVDIGVLRTTLMEVGDWVDGDLYNGKMVRVANSFLFKDPVFNYSGEFPFLWDEIKVPIKTTSDQALARSILINILEEQVGQYAKESALSWEKLTKQLYVEKAQVTPMVSMVFDENWVTYTLRYVVDFKKRRTTKDALYQNILTAIFNTKGQVEVAETSMEVTVEK